MRPRCWGLTGEPTERDKIEEAAVQRAFERSSRGGENDRARWLRALTAHFQGQVTAAETEDELDAWFLLLAGTGTNWRRDRYPTPAITELFDRVIHRLDLGPVPSIDREEFRQYAKAALMPETHPGSKSAAVFGEADRTFRILDQAESGGLKPERMTACLLRAARDVDRNRDGLVERDEYRDYFVTRVRTAVILGTDRAVPTSPALFSAEPSSPRSSRPRIRVGDLPRWWEKLDTDGDGQIGLYEWRRADLLTALFVEMDADGDGLLTAQEHAAYIKVHSAELPVELRAGLRSRR